MPPFFPESETGLENEPQWGTFKPSCNLSSIHNMLIEASKRASSRARCGISYRYNRQEMPDRGPAWRYWDWNILTNALFRQPYVFIWYFRIELRFRGLSLKQHSPFLTFVLGFPFKRVNGMFLFQILRAHFYELSFRINPLVYSRGCKTTTAFIVWQIPVVKKQQLNRPWQCERGG